jgi:hypothetical protein
MPTANSPTVRDIKIFEMIYEYDTCSADHIAAKLFQPSAKSASNGQRASYQRIATLRSRGYLTRHRLSALSGVGSGKYLLGLTPKGRKALAQELETSPSGLKRLREVETPHAGAHHLAVCDIRLSLELACQARAGLSLEWVGERELRTPPVTKVSDPRPAAGRTAPAEISLIPDGQFTIALADGAEQSFRVEVDMATTAAKRMLTKLAGYLALAADSPVLWIVPNAKRLEAIASWALKLSGELGADPTIFWITTTDQVTPETVLSPIWREVGMADLYSLLPEGGEWT